MSEGRRSWWCGTNLREKATFPMGIITVDARNKTLALAVSAGNGAGSQGQEHHPRDPGRARSSTPHVAGQPRPTGHRRRRRITLLRTRNASEESGLAAGGGLCASASRWRGEHHANAISPEVPRPCSPKQAVLQPSPRFPPTERLPGRAEPSTIFALPVEKEPIISPSSPAGRNACAIPTPPPTHSWRPWMGQSTGWPPSETESQASLLVTPGGDSPAILEDNDQHHVVHEVEAQVQRHQQRGGSTVILRCPLHPSRAQQTGAGRAHAKDFGIDVVPTACVAPASGTHEHQRRSQWITRPLDEEHCEVSLSVVRACFARLTTVGLRIQPATVSIRYDRLNVQPIEGRA